MHENAILLKKGYFHEGRPAVSPNTHTHTHTHTHTQTQTQTHKHTQTPGGARLGHSQAESSFASDFA
jgi:hypothetical protein